MAIQTCYPSTTNLFIIVSTSFLVCIDCLQSPFTNNPDPFFNQMDPNSEEHQSTTGVGQYFRRTLNIRSIGLKMLTLGKKLVKLLGY